MGSSVFHPSCAFAGEGSPAHGLHEQAVTSPWAVKDTARSLLVSGIGCPRVQPPPWCPTAPMAAKSTVGSGQLWSWVHPKAPVRNQLEGTGMPPPPCSIAGLTHRGQQQGEGRFAKGSSDPAPQNYLGRGRPPSLTHGSRTGFRGASFLPGQWRGW